MREEPVVLTLEEAMTVVALIQKWLEYPDICNSAAPIVVQMRGIVLKITRAFDTKA